ncbi:hypothetical protein pqer_cds_1031 [Pandoravirus quercus]|uniref:Uncharacterized protein n=1 Tax=Pandoravirus quercus TaxID=2107709 RepID=A0A2U7UAH9_9VIRU|nr:hypothetical protein pqer_cds_1031 [Pandoravirus quercus]AVK75453.1 hypothetical protein pqer_cds_1031 [Pandoravirus quercus]
MRRSNQPTSTRPAAARPPARTAAAGPPQAPTEWDSVRQWAADNGLDSAEAIRQWINEMAPRGLYSGIDPRAAALLQTLQQFSLEPPTNRPSEGITRLPQVYAELLETLSDPLAGSPYQIVGSRPYYPPGIDGPEWIRSLVDPLAEGGRLWPPSPATTLVRMNEVAHRAFGYGPVDSDAMLLDVTARGGVLGLERVRDTLFDEPSSFGSDLNRALNMMGDVRIDPAAPKLASDADIAQARLKWPAVSLRGALETPYIFVVGPGSAYDPLGMWTPAAGPVHVALLISRGRPIGRLVVSDTTGAVVDANGVFYQHRAPTNFEFNGDWIIDASGRDPRLVVDLLMPFVRAVREGRPDTVAMVPTTNLAGSRFWTSDQGTEQPFMARAFEPAEVLAALLAERRAAAAEAIDAATASAGGLANLAARAYRGGIATANVPDEVRQLIATQSAARACAPDATPRDRARIADAAQVLGIPEAVRRQDLTTICEASADAVHRLYGRS